MPPWVPGSCRSRAWVLPANTQEWVRNRCHHSGLPAVSRWLERGQQHQERHPSSAVALVRPLREPRLHSPRLQPGCGDPAVQWPTREGDRSVDPGRDGKAADCRYAALPAVPSHWRVCGTADQRNPRVGLERCSMGGADDQGHPSQGAVRRDTPGADHREPGQVAIAGSQGARSGLADWPDVAGTSAEHLGRPERHSRSRWLTPLAA